MSLVTVTACASIIPVSVASVNAAYAIRPTPDTFLLADEDTTGALVTNAAGNTYSFNCF